MSKITTITQSFFQTIKEEKKILKLLLIYSFLEAILVLSVPLSTTFVVNNVIANSGISVITLGLIISILFVFIISLKLTREYIVEKLQQKIFVKNAFLIANKLFKYEEVKTISKKYMNYFFDISSIQKFFPLFFLDGLGIVIKVIVSLSLLMVFNWILFVASVVVFVIYVYIFIFLSKGVVEVAVERSDTKHDSIFYLQNIHELEKREDNFLKLDQELNKHLVARNNLFKIIIKQRALTYIVDSILVGGFLILGGFMVIGGLIPIGDFIASEILILTITYSLKSFVKKLDYLYEASEGFYKIEKLKSKLDEVGDKK